MNRQRHLIIGLITAGFISFLIDGLTLGPSLGYALVGGFIGSLLPDRIEPAKHYTHRDFFHSKTLMRVLGVIMLVSLPISFFITEVWFIFYGIVGYEMHLLADGTTPMGLPD
ncbi:metal-dependent hydrolase [Candidatus Aenigmatarchaeota archaeon]